MKFTVIIPTRERSDTLYYTLKTCVTQDYDNLEILVSDNFSQDNTREVVDSFKDKRIRYVNTGKRVSMSSNWEFALSHVEDGYVTFLGDDDGLMPNAVHDVFKIIQHFKLPAVSWQYAGYAWPSAPTLPDRMYLPLRNQMIITSAKAVLPAMSRIRFSYTRGPCIYNGFVDSTAILKAKGNRERFFDSVIPDAYSSFALLSSVDAFVYCTRPFSVMGATGHSNGAKAMLPLTNLAAVSDHGDCFNQEIDLPIHQSMDLLPSCVSSSVVEALLQANDTCYGGKLNVSLRRAIWMIAREYSFRDPETYRVGMEHLNRLARRLKMNSFFVLCRTLIRNRFVNATERKQSWQGSGILGLTPSEFGVRDVFGAAELASKILGKFVMPSSVKRFKFFHPYTRFLHRKLGTYMDVP